MTTDPIFVVTLSVAASLVGFLLYRVGKLEFEVAKLNSLVTYLMDRSHEH